MKPVRLPIFRATARAEPLPRMPVTSVTELINLLASRRQTSILHDRRTGMPYSWSNWLRTRVSKGLSAFVDAVRRWQSSSFCTETAIWASESEGLRQRELSSLTLRV